MKKLLALAALFILAVTGYIVWTAFSLPDVSTLIRTNPKTTALMEQRAAENKTTLQPLNGWTPYNRISVYLRNAVVVSEDSAFFQHEGFDWTQIKESVRRDWKDKRFSRGASTITQQLAKNLFLSTSRNPLRKIQEFFIAQRLERELTKSRIFEIYLNVIEWGESTYGIHAASNRYFGKAPGELLPEEAAVLAAMIPNPRRYTPARNHAFLEKRKNEILDRMVQWNYLSRSDFESAKARTVTYRQVSSAR